MQIGIITFHFVNNFGGALQAYALQKVVKKECDSNTEIIDYQNWFIRFTDKVRLFPITKDRKELKSGLQTMKLRKGRVKKFKNFMETKCSRSKFYWNAQQLKGQKNSYDVLICGSDQIWNPYITCGVAKPYFLSFAADNAKKISYAPSFGVGNMKDHFKKQITKQLSTFDAVSVREKEGVELVEELTGEKPVQLIDPTLLLSKEEWKNAAKTVPEKEKYMLLYIMQRDDEIYEYARKLKEKLGIKLIEISRYGYQYDFVDKCIIDIGPEEFLGLFKNAEYICTNSYHGFVFSIIFEKRFSLIPSKRFQSRIISLAKLLNIDLSKLIVDGQLEETRYNKETVTEILNVEREKAINYLKSNIIG